MSNPKTIVVVQIGKIGDMILTTPLFSGLKKTFPESNLKVLASEINKDIPLNHLSVDEVIVYKKNFLKNFTLLKSSLRNVDLWIDTKNNYSSTSGVLLKIFKPKLSLGFNFEKKNFDISLKEFQKGKHAVDINTGPLNYFNKTSEQAETKPSFNIPLEIQRKFNLKLTSNLQNVIINISAGNLGRYLAKEKWLDIIKRINANELSAFTLIGLARDKEIISYLLENCMEFNINFIETKNILETSEVIKQGDIVITPDTAIVHICSAFDKPVVALYPDVKWNLQKFAPLSKFNEALVSKDEGSIKDITVEAIVNAFIKIKEKIKSGNAESRTRVRKEDH
ncbi:MAG: hypothetical protein M3R36_00885 [Bacteroidota bacterium]|nr:hypothetical protein [Bacteroidota bacterium]